MTWNWEQADWPDFTYDPVALRTQESRFLLQSGEFIGAFRHVDGDQQDTLRIELIGEEAIKTSEIEGEILSCDSVQSSLRHQFGLADDKPGILPAERGIAEMMVDLYRGFAAPLTHQTMFDWHRMLLTGDSSIQVVGGYRTRGDPMQVVSGPSQKRIVHFEAPPAAQVMSEMARFVAWFNTTAPGGARPLPALTRASIAHLWFICIHPFEDGNGRVGRALAEKSLAQNLGQPSLIALAWTIEHKRKHYYAALEHSNKELLIDDWLGYFAGTILEAQRNTIDRVDYYVAKAKFYERLRGRFNERQGKVIARMFREGLAGFRGGLSADNYITIADTSRATATRDLQDLLEKGALKKTGELRYTRYRLDLDR